MGNVRRSIVKMKQNCIKHINLCNRHVLEKKCLKRCKKIIRFYQGVREVLKARENRLQGIEGAVAELLTVPKEYEVAMEIALGAAMQHIVVQTEEHARNAIAF